MWLIIAKTTILYWRQNLYNKNRTRLVQDRIRLSCGFWKVGSCAYKARTCTRRKKSLIQGSCAYKASKKTVGLMRTRPSHKTWDFFRTRPLCVQDPHTRLFYISGRWRLGWIGYLVFVRAPAQKGIVFFWVPQSIESPYKACTRLRTRPRTRLSYQEHWKLMCFF